MTDAAWIDTLEWVTDLTTSDEPLDARQVGTLCQTLVAECTRLRAEQDTRLTEATVAFQGDIAKVRDRAERAEAEVERWRTRWARLKVDFPQRWPQDCEPQDLFDAMEEVEHDC